MIVNKVKESAVGQGFDAYNEEFVDMIEAGILDPVKVTRSALQNATSVASTLLTTESVVAAIKSRLQQHQQHLIWAECTNFRFQEIISYKNQVKAAALGNAPGPAAFLYRQKKEAFWKMISA